jgi:hypothetical protein
METSETWVAVAGIAMVTVVVTVLVAVAIVQVGATWRARMSVQREQAYQQVATESVAAAAALTEEVRAAHGRLVDIDERLTKIERMLREVG